MNYRNSLILCSILIVFVDRAAFAGNEDKSGELEDGPELTLQNEGNSSVETGPPDSHEAMNNRELNSKLEKNREKRSYEFLMGLVNNNSRYEVTNVEESYPPANGQEKEIKRTNLEASELLLELIVKIVAHPEQWEQVRRLLRNIDDGVRQSKLLLKSIEKTSKTSIKDDETANDTSRKQNTVENKQTEILEMKKNIKPFQDDRYNDHITHSTEFFEEIPKEKSENENIDTKEINEENYLKKIVPGNTTDPVQKIIIKLDETNHQKSVRNSTEVALQTNMWPHFQQYDVPSRVSFTPSDDEENLEALRLQNPEPPKYPWQIQNQSTTKNSYPRNFAYHRVTGRPLYRTNLDKNPKAYIAVSVIAPKPLHPRPPNEDLILENELRQLKPWTHQQNLKNMAALRTRWVIESEKNKENTNTP